MAHLRVRQKSGEAALGGLVAAAEAASSSRTSKRVAAQSLQDLVAEAETASPRPARRIRLTKGEPSSGGMPSYAAAFLGEEGAAAEPARRTEPADAGVAEAAGAADDDDEEMQLASRPRGDGAGISNDFCEVCQKVGKLLLCEKCPRAFHVRCIERFVDFEGLAQCSEWCCPVCVHGPEVLTGHARLKLTEDEMVARMQQAVYSSVGFAQYLLITLS